MQFIFSCIHQSVKLTVGGVLHAATPAMSAATAASTSDDCGILSVEVDDNLDPRSRHANPQNRPVYLP